MGKISFQEEICGVPASRGPHFEGTPYGWLPSSFLSPYTNRRIDGFGGSARNRAKILREIAREVEKAGLDAIDASAGMRDCPSRTRFANPGKRSYFLKYANTLNLEIPAILTGGNGNGNMESMERIPGGGKVSFIPMARPLIKESDLPNRWLERPGSETAECVSRNSCLLMVRAFRSRAS